MIKGLSKFNKGFSVMEVIVVLGIISLMITAALGEILYGQRNTLLSSNLSGASMIAHEGLEIVKGIRDADFFALDSSKKGLKLVNNTWQLDDNPENIDNFFTREIEIRDIDSWHKEVSVVVRITNTPTSTSPLPLVKMTTRFANWFPTVEDWSNPIFSGSFDFTPQNSGSNNHDSQTVSAVGNYLYIGNANSNGKEFTILDLTQSPNITVMSALDLDGSPSRIFVLGNYAYITSDSNTEELQVINISDRSNPFLTFVFNLTDTNSGNNNNDAIALDALGTKLVLGRKNSSGEELFVFDISIPDAPNLIGWLHLNGNPNYIKIIGNNVFIASSDDNQELQVVNISNPNLPVLLTSYNLTQGDSIDALSLDGADNKLYLGRDDNDLFPEFYVFNIENPAIPILLSTFDISNNSDIVHISLSSNFQNAFLLTKKDKTFQVINVSSNLLPNRLSTLNISGVPNQGDYSSLAQKFFVVGKSDPEIQIISPTLIYSSP